MANLIWSDISLCWDNQQGKYQKHILYFLTGLSWKPLVRCKTNLSLICFKLLHYYNPPKIILFFFFLAWIFVCLFLCVWMSACRWAVWVTIDKQGKVLPTCYVNPTNRYAVQIAVYAPPLRFHYSSYKSCSFGTSCLAWLWGGGLKCIYRAMAKRRGRFGKSVDHMERGTLV